MFLQIFAAPEQAQLQTVFRRMGVDPYGIRIMLPKAQGVLAKIHRIAPLAATILKQECLSIGAELAVPRDCLSGKRAEVDCLLIATASQLRILRQKLRLQPFRLKDLCTLLERGLKNIHCQRYAFKARGHSLMIGPRTALMAVMNITDDSFSGDGLLGCLDDPGALAEKARSLVKDGAQIIDIGAESSRPGSLPLSVKEELKRILPAVKAVVRAVNVPVSVDTYKPAVARACLDQGAAMINDITGMCDPLMRRLCSRKKAAVVIMHMQGRPRSMQKNPHYCDLTGELHGFFSARINACLEAGIPPESILIDPGIGFGKTLQDNLEILNRLREFKQFGVPVIVGTSRKAFIGKLTAVSQAALRLHGTTASAVCASANGAAVVRVHDVAAVRQALAVGRAITNASWSD